MFDIIFFGNITQHTRLCDVFVKVDTSEHKFAVHFIIKAGRQRQSQANNAHYINLSFGHNEKLENEMDIKGRKINYLFQFFGYFLSFINNNNIFI